MDSRALHGFKDLPTNRALCLVSENLSRVLIISQIAKEMCTHPPSHLRHGMALLGRREEKFRGVESLQKPGVSRSSCFMCEYLDITTIIMFLVMANGIYPLVHGEQAPFAGTNGFEEITWIQEPTTLASTGFRDEFIKIHHHHQHRQQVASQGNAHPSHPIPPST